MMKILFVDYETSSPSWPALTQLLRIAGPARLVNASDLRAEDLKGQPILAIGGRISGEGPGILASALARCAADTASMPYVLYADSASEEEWQDFATTIQDQLRHPALARLDIADTANEAGRRLRALKDQCEGGKLEWDSLKKRIDDFLLSHSTCALATAGPGGEARATPIEYLWRDEAFLFFSEGGLKFEGLTEGSIASLCIFDEYTSMATVRGLQVRARISLLEEASPAWTRAFSLRGVDPQVLARQGLSLNVFRADPLRFELLDARLGSSGYSSRQVLDLPQGSKEA